MNSENADNTKNVLVDESKTITVKTDIKDTNEKKELSHQDNKFNYVSRARLYDA